MKVTAVLTVRNEAAFLLEWLAHHRACGISDFLVLSNDCDDGTDLMLDRLQENGWLTHLRNRGPHPEGAHFAALKLADRQALVTGADWLLSLDIDEFLNIHCGDRTVQALLAALPDATAITLTWRLFGNAGIVAYEDRPVTETFTRAAPDPLHWPWQGLLFKTLYRNDGGYGKLGIHRPRRPSKDRLADQRWFDSSGKSLPAEFHTQKIFSAIGAAHYGLAQINHYPLGAMESFVVKRDRGRANHHGNLLDVGYWVERNFCDAEDHSILTLESAGIRQALQADPVLGPLHHAAVAWRKARFLNLVAEDAHRALFGQLMLAAPTRALTPWQARMIWGHNPAVRSGGTQPDN